MLSKAMGVFGAGMAVSHPILDLDDDDTIFLIDSMQQMPQRVILSSAQISVNLDLFAPTVCIKETHPKHYLAKYFNLHIKLHYTSKGFYLAK